MTIIFESLKVSGVLGELQAQAAYPKNPKYRKGSGIMIIHGAGVEPNPKSGILSPGIAKFQAMQYLLAKRGHTVWVYDQAGIGGSVNIPFSENTPASRTEDARLNLHALLKYPWIDQTRIGLIGQSLGGFTALRLTEKERVRSVLGFGGAAYPAAAEDKKFGEPMREVLHIPGSWRSSLAYPNLEAYAGDVLWIYGEKDTTIYPKEIQGKYQQIISRKGNQDRFLYLPDVDQILCL